jgi:hypothetical protein
LPTPPPKTTKLREGEKRRRGKEKGTGESVDGIGEAYPFLKWGGWVHY